MHATDYLKNPDKHVVPPIVVVQGGEWQLKQSVLKAIVAQVLGGDEEDDLSVTRFAGKETELRSVRDELLTVSMFADQRIVIVDDADDFISNHRDGLESYADQPARSSTLILNCKSWRKNTRLAKKVTASGLEIDCSELAGGRLTKWLTDQARDQHGKQLQRDAAGLMVELVGTGLALLDQELAKLAAYAGDREQITAEDVQGLVGGWKAETTWAMTNAVRDGNVAVALQCLDQLLNAGEAAPKLLGGINFVFRKLAQATERSRTGVPLNVALKESGVFPRDIDATDRYLRRIGRPRAEQILARLLRADADLKGASRDPDRLQMERLLLDLAGTTPLTT
ncbi:MAG: DNA polymerase III subunit delta [Planctomycetaceae bacterium]|nr:DNA polymerase III subunit delta [Planctomycetaceae bacterium]